MMFEVLDAMVKEPDFVSTWVHEKLDEPDMLVLYETWACTQNHFLSYHIARPYRQAFERALPGLLAADRHIEFLQPIRAYPSNRACKP